MKATSTIIPIATEVGVLDDKIAATSLTVVLAHEGISGHCEDRHESGQIFCSASKIVSLAPFVLPVYFLQVWM